MDSNNAEQCKHLAHEFSLQAAIDAPASLTAPLHAYSRLLKLMAWRPDREAILLHRLARTAVSTHPEAMADLLADDLHGATSVRNDYRADPPLPFSAALVQQTGAGAIEIKIEGPITKWTLPMDFLKERISAASRVKVLLSSVGGDPTVAMELYDALIQRVTTVDIITAYSAAVTIAMAGRHRRIARKGFMAIHAGTACVLGTAQHLRDRADRLENSEKAITKIIAENTGVPLEVAEAWNNSPDSYFFNAEDAVKVGLAHEIFDPYDRAADRDAEAADLARELLPRLRSIFDNPERFEKVLQSFMEQL